MEWCSFYLAMLNVQKRLCNLHRSIHVVQSYSVSLELDVEEIVCCVREMYILTSIVKTASVLVLSLFTELQI